MDTLERLELVLLAKLAAHDEEHGVELSAYRLELETKLQVVRRRLGARS